MCVSVNTSVLECARLRFACQRLFLQLVMSIPSVQGYQIKKSNPRINLDLQNSDKKVRQDLRLNLRSRRTTSANKIVSSS